MDDHVALSQYHAQVTQLIGEIRAKIMDSTADQSRLCQLCGESVLSISTAPVWIALRWAGGQVVLREGELWCPGCTRLTRDLESAKTMPMIKGKD